MPVPWADLERLASGSSAPTEKRTPTPEPQAGIQRARWEAAYLKPNTAIGWKNGELLPNTIAEWSFTPDHSDLPPESPDRPVLYGYRPFTQREHDLYNQKVER